MTHTEKLKLEEKMNELPKTITRNKLIDWFIDNEDKLFRKITVKQLIQVAQEKGIYVKNANLYEALTFKEKDLIKELYDKRRLSVAEIAKEMQLTRREVHKRLKENSVHIRNDDIKAYYNTFTKKEIEELYKNYKLEEIYEKLGIGSRALYMLLDKFGIERIGKGKGRCKIA